jgi:hypothetical protein
MNIITGTVNNLGNDLLLDASGDLIFGSNGDLFTTDDADVFLGDALPFRGYTNLNETMYKIIQAVQGSYPFDIYFGASVPLYISKTVTAQMISQIRTQIGDALVKDDRIKSVDQIDITFKAPKTLIISIFVTAIGQQQSSQFVFPYQLN